MTTIATKPAPARNLSWMKRGWPMAAFVVVGLTVARVLGYETRPFVVLLGAVLGSTYGLLAVAMVLVFRTSRVINFAQAQIGALAAVVVPILVLMADIPYWVAFVLALLTGALVGILVEALLVIRLEHAPRVIVVVATLGVGVVLNQMSRSGLDWVYETNSTTMVEPPGVPKIEVGSLLLTPNFTVILVIAPILVIALTTFLARHRYGLALRAVSTNPDAAQVSGIGKRASSSLAWALSGALATIGGVLLPGLATKSAANVAQFDAGLILKVLCAAVIARMVSMPAAMLAGVAIGIVEQVVLWHDSTSTILDAIVVVFLMVIIIFQKRPEGRSEKPGSWAAVAVEPDRLRDRPGAHALRYATWALTATIAAVVGWQAWQNDGDATKAVLFLAALCVVLAASVATGLLGELSLGQYAVALLSGALCVVIVSRTGLLWQGILAALAGGAIIHVLLGLPSLRMRGLSIVVTTLAFATAVPSLILPSRHLFGDAGIAVNRPIIAGRTLATGAPMLIPSLVLAAIAFLLAANVWRGGLGRTMRAIRDNEPAARAFGVPATRFRLIGLAIAGLIAGFGGLILIYSQDQVASGLVPAQFSVFVVLALAVGGLSRLSGAVLGAVWVFGLPGLVPGDALSQATSSSGALAIVLLAPAGLVGVVAYTRARILRRAEGRDAAATSTTPVEPGAIASGGEVAETATPETATPETDPVPPRRLDAVLSWQEPATTPAINGEILRVEALSKSYGGIAAVREVSFAVNSGELLALIGPNGAGKTTTFEMISGFVRPMSGQVLYLGHDITNTRPESRVDLGLVRSFQSATLFPTLTVEEVLLLALEQQHPTPVVRSLLGVDTTARHRNRLCAEVMGHFGLIRYRHHAIGQLSTGTRRLVELAALLVLQPRLLLLDEPSSGVAQREVEALGTLLRSLVDDLHVTLLVIEHDIGLVMQCSDRVVAMAEGRLLAEGTPEHVRNDPAVIDAYFGADSAALSRSGRISRSAN